MTPYVRLLFSITSNDRKTLYLECLLKLPVTPTSAGREGCVEGVHAGVALNAYMPANRVAHVHVYGDRMSAGGMCL